MALCFVLLFVSAFITLNAANKSDDSSLYLSHVGTVGTKSIFEAHGVTRNWQEAKEYCEGLGMKLVTIETEAEAALVTNRDRIAYVYWIAARDSFEPSQFVWDGTNRTVPEGLIGWNWEFHPQVPQTCFFLDNRNDPSTLSVYLCNEKIFGLLCQIQA